MYGSLPETPATPSEPAPPAETEAEEVEAELTDEPSWEAVEAERDTFELGDPNSLELKLTDEAPKAPASPPQPGAAAAPPATSESARPRTAGSYSMSSYSMTGTVERTRPLVAQPSAAQPAPPPATPTASGSDRGAAKAPTPGPPATAIGTIATTQVAAPRGTEPPPSNAFAASIDKELRSRAERLRREDPVGAARAQLELGLLYEWAVEDRGRARKHYEMARDLVRTLQPALTRLRRIGSAQSAIAGSPDTTRELLDMLEVEISVAETDLMRADLLATRARVLEHLNRLADARAAYTEALHFAPKHPAALHGLEVILRREILDDAKTLHGDLADHLQRVADAYSPDGSDGDAGLASWICVERAEVLERNLKELGNAREALKRSVALSPQPGPVRAAFVRFLSRHDREAGLMDALRVEAEREPDQERAARLLYSSARIALDRGANRGDAVPILLRAEQRAPHTSLIQERILGELVSQLDADGDHTKLVEIRVKRLSLIRQREAIAYEYVRLADAYGRLGRADLAADAAARALAQDPTSRTIRENLDQALSRLGRHADRVRSWLNEGNSDRPERLRLQAFIRAADIAARQLNQPDHAVDALRTAWLLSPGNGAVFDALSGLLRAPPRATEEATKNAEQRLDLYHQAAATEADKDRKLALLEKALSIYEDELGRHEDALALAERMLAMDPGRRTTVVAIQRNARRSGKLDKLATALLDEVKQTKDDTLRVRLLLEAADVSEKMGDRERALSLIDRALVAKAGDPDAARARADLLRRMSRFEDARKTLVALAEREAEAGFETWLEVADLDESNRKSWSDAVDAYRAAQKLRPNHPLPMLSLFRLLRTTKNFKRLVTEIKAFTRSDSTQITPRALAQLNVMCAEIEELCLGDDEAALKSLTLADEALRGATPPDPAWDPAVFESQERILFRVGDDDGLLRLYAKWLERQPPAAVDHTLRVGLAGALESTSPAQSIEVLDALVAVVPTHIPALRRLTHLHRARRSYQPLAATLFMQAGVFTSRVARVGALWEVVTLEERLGAGTTLDALARITKEFPHDVGALDAIARIASKLVAGGATPHPSTLAVRSQLLGATRARRELAVDPLARASYLLEEATLLETAPVDADPRAALDSYKEAQTLWPDSFLAARGLERIGEQLGDHQAVITSQLSLAKLVETHTAKAEHLVRAAELTARVLRDARTALELYEVALETDAENRDAAKALVGMLASDPRRLIDRLRPALDRAGTQTQVTYLGLEIAQAYLKIHTDEGDAARMDFTPGILALKRAIKLAAEPTSLFLLARLYSAQHAWAEARETYQRIVEVVGNGDPKTRLAALFALVELYEGPMGDAQLAESTLVSILSGDPGNKAALERLFSLAVKNGDKKLARSSLERLAEYETDLAQRTEYQMRVAEVCREAQDGAGMLRALSDAVVSTPQDLRPWSLLTRLYRSDTTEGAAGLAHAIEQILEQGKARRRPLEARWLVTLGLLEVNVLKRLSEGIAHLQAAVGAASAPSAGSPTTAANNLPELRAALGTGLLSAGRTKDAITILRELASTEHDLLLRMFEPSAYNTVRSASVAATGTILGSVLTSLDAALATEGRADERLVCEEVRAALGDVPPDRVQKLRTRRIEPDAPAPNQLAQTEIVRTMVAEARSPFIDVAISIQPIVGKVIPLSISNYGVTSREKVGPRDGNPTRALADRIARCLGFSDFELYLSGAWNGPLHLFPGDPPMLVAHHSFSELPEGEQAFALGRMLARIAMGMTWLDVVTPDVCEALLLSAVRQVLPQWGNGELGPQREAALANVHVAMQRAIGRKQRKAIEERAQSLSPSMSMGQFFAGVRRSEYRAGYILSGNLLTSLEGMQKWEADLMHASENPRAYLQNRFSNELIRYALSPDGFSDRRYLGTIFSGTL
ncbi:MAG: cellulose synthase [Polyangiaceae bacterium]